MDKSSPSGAAARTLFLVDGTAQLYRAYFALPGLTNRDGLPTHAVYGYVSMLRKLIADERPCHLAVAFDLPGPVFRHVQFAEYKANRPPTPADLKVQAPYARQATEALGVTVLERTGFEADDLIAAYTARARAEGFDVVVVSSDKDLLQLVGEGVQVLNPNTDLRLDSDGVLQRFGVRPQRVVDVLGLMGDSVDNIPGVPGVGEKTAVAVVSRYGDLEAVISRAARFVAAYDARDRLLESVAAVETAESLSAEMVDGARTAAAACGEALEELARIEPDGEIRQRWSSVAELLGEIDIEALERGVDGPGRVAARALRPLKKGLKSLDRGSSKRSWYLIDEHVEQARMSRELARLQPDVPGAVPLESLELRAADREQAAALFGSLGFRALTEEFAASAADDGTAEPDAVASAPFECDAVLSEQELGEVVEACRSSGSMAIWAVADGDDPMTSRLIGLALAATPERGWYIPVGHRSLDAPAQVTMETVALALAPVFEHDETLTLAHDAKSALHLLERHGLAAKRWSLDTMVAAFLLNPGRSDYRLERMAEEYLGASLPPEPSLGRGQRRDPVTWPLEQARQIGATRAAAVLRLAKRLGPLLDEAGVAELYRGLDGPLLPLLARMERRGIRVDGAILERMSGEMQEALVRTRDEIHRLAGTEFNVDSTKQLREVLFERLGLRPKRKTAKGKVASTDAQTLEELAEEHAIAREILEYRELSKLKGTYVDALPRMVDPDSGRVHTRFHPTGAATGRLSSSDPNMQNIPARTAAGRKIRAAFVPDSGFVFLASDYSQVELRILAHLTEDPELTAAFRAGEDIHRFTAAQVFGVIPGLVTDEMRQRAKAVNFGVLYGMSEMRLAREQGIKRSEARAFIEAYFDRFANVRGYIERIRDEVRRDGAVRTLFGRVRYFPQLRQKVNRAVQEQALRAAVNTTIQGTAADLMKRAMLDVDARLLDAGSGARLLLQVHDELLLEVPLDELEEATRIVSAAMEGVHPLSVPLAVDQKTGASWLEVT